MRGFFGQLAALACVIGLPYVSPAQAQSPQVQDEARKADFDTRMADIRRRQSAVPYSDQAARIALLTERAKLIAGYHGEASVAHADALQLLAFEYYSEKRWAEDAALRARALEIRRKVEGDRSSDTLYAVRALAHSLAEDHRRAEATKILADVLQAWQGGATLSDAAERTVPRGRTVEGKALGMAAATHAKLALDNGDAASALASSRIAAASSLAYRRGFGVGVLDEQMVELAERDPSTHTGEETFAEWSRLYADVLWEADQAGPSAKGDALLVLQDIMAGRTSRALARSAATRAAAASGAAGLAADRDAKAAELGALFARSEGMKTGSEADRALWQDIGTANTALEAIDARLTAATPGYFELIKPAMLNEASAKALLGADEAFLMIVPTPRGTHSLIVTHEGIDWHRSAMTEAELAGHVRRLLWDVGADIDVTPEEDERWSAEGEGDFPFDRGTAFHLYEELIAPVSKALAGKRHLFTSATGSISSLPLGILVTEKPEGVDGDPATLRATPWFADKVAIVQLPSLQSLQLLRAVADRDAPDRGNNMIGFGDPLLEGNAATRGVEGRTRMARGGNAPLASNIWRTSSGETQLADPAALRRLARLPGTAKELKAMETLVGSEKTKLFLAGEATETKLKGADLASASVLFLATHGLVAGEVGDIGEPGLVFTPPVVASPADDGLLTASEVASLRIGAEWVILSACNTAAGDGRAGAPSLSGLARAFFFAGSESLLASHWPVRDDVAAILTVRLFEILQGDPGLSRAEALQQVEREIRDDTRDDPYLKSWSHPSAWAPFSLIGDVGR
ncbi:CHAT domain-containing tetratricopeptide repeat protein [Sphingopyxis sp. C-1]|uniref:CHAT domain-containing protein n=1 Tax=Sphingopyxis sp. C-1 TaxID=262667 RepID=UPI0006C1D563|nr:CHAT domain-containing tetratricopeptide repeat protein [Sphingopyxis sp. C-1]GAO77497.1 TPR repeat [Sphingopyxis sp. C-1]